MCECDFFFPRPSARKAARSLDKGEMELCASEWKALIDRYISGRPMLRPGSATTAGRTSRWGGPPR